MTSRKQASKKGNPQPRVKNERIPPLLIPPAVFTLERHFYNVFIFTLTALKTFQFYHYQSFLITKNIIFSYRLSTASFCPPRKHTRLNYQTQNGKAFVWSTHVRARSVPASLLLSACRLISPSDGPCSTMATICMYDSIQ